jgi:hypothetical protein
MQLQQGAKQDRDACGILLNIAPEVRLISCPVDGVQPILDKCGQQVMGHGLLNSKRNSPQQLSLIDMPSHENEHTFRFKV